MRIQKTAISAERVHHQKLRRELGRRDVVSEKDFQAALQRFTNVHSTARAANISMRWFSFQAAMSPRFNRSA